MEGLVNRAQYLDKLKKWKDKDLIKVVTGIRRCGKSTLFSLFIDYLKSTGVDDLHIIAINLESLDNEFATYKELYDHVKSKIVDNEMHYVFLDEVQNVENFQKCVDGLFIVKNLDVYITGSNAFLLSGELATLLTGRYVEIKMLPLSFKEYLSYYGTAVSERAYVDYINKSSFPYALKLEDEAQVDDYLDALYNTIILKDVVQRHKIADISLLKVLAQFMFSNIGNCLSVKKIVDTLNSQGKKISAHTVETYLNALVESYIFNKAERFDLKGRQYLQSGEKYYATDVAMRWALLGRKNVDAGHMLENVVYLELIRRGFKVYVGKMREKEIDFVAENKDGFTYYQVAYTVRDSETLKRELLPLNSLKDHYPKYLLTMDVDPISDYNGVKKLNVLDWLTE